MDVGVAHKTIVAWESGTRRPGPANLYRLAESLGLDPARLLTIPREHWTLVTLRTVHGLEQKVAAKLIRISAQRLRHIEDGVNEMTPDVCAALVRLYREAPEVIIQCWATARARLMNSRDPLPSKQTQSTTARETSQ